MGINRLKQVGKCMNEFIFKMQVYSEDTDSFGIVHHANFLKFMERARLAWLFKLGFRLDSLLEKGVLFVVKKIEIDYVSPARLYDELEIFSTVIELRKASKIYEQTIYNAQDKSKIFCKAHIQVVCVNAKLRPQAIPQEIINSCLGERE